MVVRSWNAAAEQLTGIPAAEALGRTCWELLGAVDEHGAIVCHAGCSGFRLAREGRPAPTRHVAMATVANSGTFLHVLTDAPGGPEDEPLVDGELADRQRQILERIAAGHPAKVIARELGIAEVTVRNHIRAILLSLGCHSQLEAVAEARRRRILA